MINEVPFGQFFLFIELNFEDLKMNTIGAWITVLCVIGAVLSQIAYVTASE